MEAPEAVPPEARVNAYLHANAAGRPVNEACGPFHIGFDPHDDMTFLNYAVPCADATPTPEDIASLVAAFERRSRRPRLEFAPAGAPVVEPALLAVGFEVEERLPFMICAAADLACHEDVPGVSVVVLTDAATDEELHGLALAQHEAFVGPAEGAADPDFSGAVEGLRSAITRGGCLVLARGAEGTDEAGTPMGGGQFAPLRAGTTEVAGIAVRSEFRRRGIGGAVTGLLSQEAFERGAECVWLTPAGADQERLYASLGYRSTGKMLFISKPRAAAASTAPGDARPQRVDDIASDDRGRAPALGRLGGLAVQPRRDASGVVRAESCCHQAAGQAGEDVAAAGGG